MSDVRKESIMKIQRAYETEQLGFQKGMSACKYYDSKTDSCCAVGIIIDRHEILQDKDGDILSPFRFGESTPIDQAMDRDRITTFKGLTKEELGILQGLHDVCTTVFHKDDRIARFESYLYSLEA